LRLLLKMRKELVEFRLDALAHAGEHHESVLFGGVARAGRSSGAF
jgi:hypothetical protein